MVKVYAKFDRMIDAKKAAEALKDLGYQNAHIDIADRFHNEFSSELGITGKRTGASLSDVFLNSRSKSYSVDKGPLIASDPIVSGNGTKDVMLDTNVHLLINVDENKISELEKALNSLGGTKL